jgi:hypothetical protein
MRRLAVLLVVLVAGCGGGSAVDGDAVQAAMPSFVRQQSVRTPGLDLPVYDDDEDVLLASAGNGADPDDLCQRLTSYLSTNDLDGVKVRITAGLFSGDALASGESGKGC